MEVAATAATNGIDWMRASITFKAADISRLVIKVEVKRATVEAYVVISMIFVELILNFNCSDHNLSQLDQQLR